MKNNQQFDKLLSVKREIKPITDEGAFKLAAAILETAYADYARALLRIIELWKLKEQNPNKFTSSWQNAIRLKRREEIFYESDTFNILTLGKSAPGRDVIKKIQKINGYNPEIHEK